MALPPAEPFPDTSVNHRLRDSRERLYGSAGERTKALFHKGFSSVYALVTIFYTFIPSSGLRRAETSRLDGTPPAGSSSRHNQRLARKSSSASSARYRAKRMSTGSSFSSARSFVARSAST